MYALRAARCFDGQAALTGGVTVLVAAGRIVGVESGRPEVAARWSDLDYPGGTVLPGLVDAHVHLGGDGANGALDRLADYTDGVLQGVIERALQHHLSAGVTTVRDLGDRGWSVLAWRDQQRGPGLASSLPTIVASGPPITSVGGHCAAMGGQVDGPDAIRAAIHGRAERRVDVVKIMASGGNMTPGTDVQQCQFTLAELRIAVEEAHSLGLPITAHAHGLPAVECAVRAGVDGIEHCTCLVEGGVEQPDALFDAIVDAGIDVCPTLGRTPGSVPPLRVLEMMRRTGMTWEKRQAFVARMGQRGVRLASGTDGGIAAGKPHGILSAAAADLVAGGLSATEALTSATSVAAQACGVGDRKGRVRPGYDADLLVVDGDPTTDIGTLARVNTVMLHGNIVLG